MTKSELLHLLEDVLADENTPTYLYNRLMAGIETLQKEIRDRTGPTANAYKAAFEDLIVDATANAGSAAEVKP